MIKILISLLLVLPTVISCRAFATLAIDASTPATVKAITQTITTASFTPPAGSVLYILLGLNSCVSGCQHNKVTGITDNLGTHLTYTQVLKEGTEDGDDALVYLYTAPVSSSQSMTISVTQESSADSAASSAIMKVLVITGANASSFVGASGGNRGATGVISDTYSSTVNNSWGWLIYADWNAVGVPTAGSNQTVYDSYQIAGQDSYALIQQNSTTAASGTSVTMSTTAPTSGAQTVHLYFEMKPPGTHQNIVGGNSTIGGVSTLN